MPHPESRQRLLLHGLAELPTDINGFPGGRDYEPFLMVGDMRSRASLRRVDEGVWSGRTHHLASQQEFKVKQALEANFFILGFREQYPCCSRQVLADILAGKDVSRNRVWTFDFVITLRPASFGGPLRYMALSSKPLALRAMAASDRRARREARHCKSLAWNWGYVQVPDETEARNYKKLHQWAKAYPLDDGARDAAELGPMLYQTTSRKPLWGVLSMLGRRLGIPEDDQFFVFAAAYYLGWVALDHRCLVDEELPLTLMSPPHG